MEVARAARWDDHPPTPGDEVRAVAPVRVCDLGGWTDTWFSVRGTVFNIAVSPFVVVDARIAEPAAAPHRIMLEAADFGDRYGFAPGRGPGRHPLLEATIDEVGVPDGVALEIRVASGVPAGCSTGTSAAVAVALVGALDALAPPSRSLAEVARTAHRVEVERLGLESGVQDQLCAAFGGISLVEVDPYPEAVRTAVPASAAVEAELERRLVVVHLGLAHQSSEMHERVIASLSQDSPQLQELRNCAMAAREAVVAGDLERLGRAMTRNTEAQRGLHRDLVSEQAQHAIDVAAAQGASGWTINGAGGEGGSLTLLCGPEPDGRARLERSLVSADPMLHIIRTRLSRRGLRVQRVRRPAAAS